MLATDGEEMRPRIMRSVDKTKGAKSALFVSA